MSLSPYAYTVTKDERAQQFHDADLRVKQLERQKAAVLVVSSPDNDAAYFVAMFPVNAVSMGVTPAELELLQTVYDAPGGEAFKEYKGWVRDAEEIERRVDAEFGRVIEPAKLDRDLKYWRGVRSRAKSKM